MWHYAAFYLGFHRLQKYSFRGFPRIQWVNISKENYALNALHMKLIYMPTKYYQNISKGHKSYGVYKLLSRVEQMPD